MRDLAILAAICLSGGAGVTALANLPTPRPIAATPAPARFAEVPAPPAMPPPPPPAPPLAMDDGVFINTYYDFPADPGDMADVTVFTPRCAPIARVSRAFHDAVCVQGSGRLASGVTISFAERGCACAELCPRTGQRICYDALDRARFPSGRGSTGRPITPLRTVAVDPAVIALGTHLFIPEYVGLPRPDGSRHDGCFVAEDRGVRILGRRVDVFAGDVATRRLWDASVPSGRGVHLQAGAARCARRRTAQARAR